MESNFSLCEKHTIDKKKAQLEDSHENPEKKVLTDSIEPQEIETSPGPFTEESKDQETIFLVKKCMSCHIFKQDLHALTQLNVESKQDYEKLRQKWLWGIDQKDCLEYDLIQKQDSITQLEEQLSKMRQEQQMVKDQLSKVKCVEDNLRDQLKLERQLSKNEAEKNAILQSKIEKLEFERDNYGKADKK